MIQAMDSRDALAKLLYSCLFDWLVEQITFCRETSVWEDPSAFLIFMDPNHLTYEYIQDCIDWAKVDFEDNQACLSLFEKDYYPYLLDEETTFPNTTDMSFANKLKQHLNDNPCFGVEENEAKCSHFIIMLGKHAQCTLSGLFF
ncbi:putative myosin ATPase [Helianthus annuus]|nr:putative myosin ATPase [Helianthus annuus]KAJ0584118.1 putative myosin ATPase [Helianthus annuus]KAJ0746707.1 putative myosin ATPase [Helianthus annuus]KAJ0749785.1 putative myosin ATPase [Helianthus annuus]